MCDDCGVADRVRLSDLRPSVPLVLAEEHTPEPEPDTIDVYLEPPEPAPRTMTEYMARLVRDPSYNPPRFNPFTPIKLDAEMLRAMRDCRNTHTYHGFIDEEETRRLIEEEGYEAP
jgi:hypothetical protein